MKQQLSEFDTFYISYDEPKCEENWANLLEKAPWAKRVHGVKGFDAAHKACADQSETGRFITIDGDNIVDEKLFDLVIDIPEKYKNCAFSWNSINNINGLVYGNGGVKLWTRDWVHNMKSHENAVTEEEKLDFCWDKTYLQLDSVLSITHPEGSMFQAFRAGFREGCKMTLNEGARVDPVLISKVVYQENLRRLLVWSCVGADVDNGVAAIYGTRLGICMTNLDPNFELSNISDYEWFKAFGEEELAKFKSSSRLETNQLLGEECFALGSKIKKYIGLELCIYNPSQSKFFKSVQTIQHSPWSMAIEAELGL